MTPFFVWLSLGLCPFHMGGDDELTMRTCQALFDSKHRKMESVNIAALIKKLPVVIAKAK